MVMFIYLSMGDVHGVETFMDVSGRLGLHTADFVAWTVAELPEEWLRPVQQVALEQAARELDAPADKLQPCAVLELPDSVWAWRYEVWHRTNFGSDPSYVRVMLTPRDNFRGEESAVVRRRMAADALRALVETGKPPPFFTRVFAVKE